MSARHYFGLPAYEHKADIAWLNKLLVEGKITTDMYLVRKEHILQCIAVSHKPVVSNLFTI